MAWGRTHHALHACMHGCFVWCASAPLPPARPPHTELVAEMFRMPAMLEVAKALAIVEAAVADTLAVQRMSSWPHSNALSNLITAMVHQHNMSL